MIYTAKEKFKRIKEANKPERISSKKFQLKLWTQKKKRLIPFKSLSSIYLTILSGIIINIDIKRNN